MVNIKICGIRRKEDVQYVNEFLPEYVGFVFAKSKRQVSTDEAFELSKTIDNNIKTVGVFVDAEIDFIIEAIKRCGLNVVQLHGNESVQYVKKLKSLIPHEMNIWKAIKADEKEIAKCKKYDVDAFLIDAFTKDSFGGSGKVFDWELALCAKRYGRIIVAGGLNEKNVEEAIGKTMPYAVDVSSGVEINGVKDREKIRNFIYKIRYNAY